MFLNRCCDNDNMGTNKEINGYQGMQMGTMQNSCCSCCPPVMECPQERVCHRQICYEVPHIIPINTRIINHHVYRHTYQPMYTCTMEDEVCNVYDQCNGGNGVF